MKNTEYSKLICENIVNLVSLHIERYNNRKKESLQSMTPANEFYEFAVAGIRMGRCAGHTMAAKELMKKYNAILFLRNEFEKQTFLQDIYTESEDLRKTFDKRIFAATRFENDSNPNFLRGKFPTKHPIQLVIIDNASIIPEKCLTNILNYGIFVNTPYILLG